MLHEELRNEFRVVIWCILFHDNKSDTKFIGKYYKLVE